LGGNIPRSAIFEIIRSKSDLNSMKSSAAPSPGTSTPVNEHKYVDADSDTHTSTASASGGDLEDPTLLMDLDTVAMTGVLNTEEETPQLPPYDCFDAMDEGNHRASESTASYTPSSDILLEEITSEDNKGHSCSPVTDDCASSSVGSATCNDPSKSQPDDMSARQDTLSPHDIVFHGKIKYGSRFPFKQVCRAVGVASYLSTDRYSCIYALCLNNSLSAYS